MSLAALALRLATVQALTGRTIAAARVHDSRIAPLDETVADEVQPVVVVYTDDERGTVTGRDWGRSDRTLDLVVEMAMAGQTAIPAGDDGEGEGVEISIPHTDEGMELALDIAARQVRYALTAAEGTWPELWRRLVLRIERVETKRAADAKENLRFAARQLLVRVEPIEEPTFGEPPAGVWVDVLAALRASGGGLDVIADGVEAMIEGGPALAAWRVAQVDQALTSAGAAALGIAPVATNEVDGLQQPPPLAAVQLGEDPGSPVIDQAAVDQEYPPDA